MVTGKTIFLSPKGVSREIFNGIFHGESRTDNLAILWDSMNAGDRTALVPFTDEAVSLNSSLSNGLLAMVSLERWPHAWNRVDSKSAVERDWFWQSWYSVEVPCGYLGKDWSYNLHHKSYPIPALAIVDAAMAWNLLNPKQKMDASETIKNGFGTVQKS
jgi:hypothetical protein